MQFGAGERCEAQTGGGGVLEVRAEVAKEDEGHGFDLWACCSD